ncbi:unnamed protein product [Heterobilharzia americana]|nr:unnamed protein product [Heterobilharzia americana]
MIKDEDGLENFVHEDHNHVTDDNGNLYLINLNWMLNKHLIYTCVVNSPILRTMKTGPDINVFYSNSLPLFNDFLSSKKPEKSKILFHSEEKQTGLVNESLSIKCIIYGSPLPQVLWEFMESTNSGVVNNQEFRNIKLLPEKYGIKLKNHGTELYIPSVKTINRGSYRCSAMSSSYTAPAMDNPQVIFDVDVESKPHFADYPKNTVVPENGSISLRCSVDEEITKPSATITWLVNGEPVERYLDGLRKVGRNNILFLYNLTVHDSAVFQCVLRNIHGWNIVNAYIHVWNQPPAFVNVIEGIKYISEGHQVILPCETFGAPEAEINWFLNGKDLDSLDNIKGDYVIENGNLNLPRAKLSHIGEYTCQASNVFGTSKSSGKLLVRKQTRIISGPLSEQVFNEKNNKRIKVKYLTEGSMVYFSCEAETDPLHKSQLKLSWRKDNITLDDTYRNDKRFNLSSDGKSLMIIKLNPSDTGIYMCVASTQLDNANSSIYLIIQGRPTPPKYLKLSCERRSRLAPYAMLTWQIGETNNAAIEKVLITYVAGFYRPLEASSFSEQSHIEPLFSEGHQRDKFKQLIKSNNTDDNQLYWLNKSSLEVAQMIIKEAVLKDQWHLADLVPESEIIEHIRPINRSISKIDNTVNLPKLPSEIGRAFVRLNADVFYHFRVELLNHIGKSLPSEIIPSLSDNRNVMCILPPTPTSSNPDYLVVYGNEPNNLIIQWKPLDPIQHNGPGLVYRLTVNCLDCIIGPPKDVENVTIVRNWSKDKLELTDIITPQVLSMNIKNKTSKWSIETFRTYQVILQAENYLGSYGIKPLVFTGRSGEDVPQLSPNQLKVLQVGSNNILLSWKIIKEADFVTKINGIFQGFRVEWCDAELSSDSCEFYKNFQDYIVEHPPLWSLPGLRRKSTTSIKIPVDKNNDNEVMNLSKISSMSEQKQTDTLANIKFEDGVYKAYLNELPGKSKLKSGDTVIVETKEGVPGKVSEFTITFIGVNHIEVSWIKPMILNGFLTSYDLEIYLNNFTNNGQVFSKGLKIVSSITIEDPEQCATRISGLKMNTNYSLYIWAKTAMGPTFSQDFSFIPFKINSVQNHENSINLTLITPLSSLSQSSTLSSSSVYDLNDSVYTTNDSIDSIMPLFRNKPDFNDFNSKGNRKFSIFSQRRYQTMFYVQFRQLGTEIWEETQKEIHNSWVVLSNLEQGCQYEVRIVCVSENGRSTVSGSKIVNIPLSNSLMMINKWKILSKHNQKLIIVSVLCGLFLYSALHKPNSNLVRDNYTPESIHKRTESVRRHYPDHHQQQHHQYEPPIEQYPEPHMNWTLDEEMTLNNIDYLTYNLINVSNNSSFNTTAYQLGSCVCESGIPHNNNNDNNNTSTTITTNSNINKSIPLIHGAYITDCDPLVNNCITFLKLPQSQTNSLTTEENFPNSLVNLDNPNHYYNNSVINHNNNNNNIDNNTIRQTYIGSLLNRI